MAVKYLKAGQSFGPDSFPKEFGFTGSAAGRSDPKPQPKRSADEFGDGLKKGGAVCMANGGPVIRKEVTTVLPAQQSPVAAASQMKPTGMKKGGKFIGQAVKDPGRMKNYAKKLGVSTKQAMVKASHSSDSSLRSAGALGLRLTSGDLSHRKSKK